MKVYQKTSKKIKYLFCAGRYDFSYRKSLVSLIKNYEIIDTKVNL